MRLIPIKMFSTLAALWTCPAFAFDSEPNDSLSEAEVVGPTFIQRGSLGTSTDTTDVFEWTARGSGTLVVQLTNHHSSFHELDLEIQDAEENVVATSAVEDVTLDVEVSVAEGDTLYLVLRALDGEANYTLSTAFLADSPTLTSLSDSDPDPGDSITLAGAGFGASCDDLLVYVGQTLAEVTSCSNASLSVVVPANAYDGDAWVVRFGQHSEHLPITINGGTSTPPHASWLTAPDPSELVTFPSGALLYFNRVLVGFLGDLDEVSASGAIDAAVADVNLTAGSTVLVGWDEAGFSPRTNVYQVELDWDSSATPADWWELFETLRDSPEVTLVGGEYPLFGTAPQFGPGQDVATSWSGVQTGYGAFDITAIEEAWRLFASTSATGLVPNVPKVLVVDSGLLQVDFTADGGSHHEFLDGSTGNVSLWRTPETSGDCVANDFTLYTSDSSWHDGSETSTKPSHGNLVSALIAASNNGVSRWNGTDSGGIAQRLAGVLGGLQQWGVNDNAHDYDTATDEQGEMIRHETSVLNGFRCGGSTSTLGLNPTPISYAIESIGLADFGSFIPDVIVYPISLPLPNEGDKETSARLWEIAALPMASTPLWVTSAGNAIGSMDDFSKTASLSTIVGVIPEVQTLTVTGSHSDPTSADQRASWGSQYAPLPPASDPPPYIAAPARAWTVLKDSDSTNYTNVWGTTVGTALVGGIAAMLKAADEHDDLAGGAALRNHILNTATDITGKWDTSTAMTRVDASAALAELLAMNGHLDRAIRVVIADNQDTNPRVCSQVYDPAAFEFVDDTDACYLTSTDGCDPVAVEVDPRGDLIYALCNDSTARVLVLAPVTTSGLPEDTELRKVGLITLTGKTTSVYAELAATAEGYLVVPVINSSGDSEFVVIDTYDGSLLSSGTALHGSGVTRTGSVAVTRDHTTVAVTGTDGDSDVSDEEVATIDIQAYARVWSPHGVGTFGLGTLPDPGGTVRAIDWHGGEGVFFAAWHSELGTSDFATIGPKSSPPPAWEVRDEVDLGSSEAIYDLAVNPTDEDELAYVANFESGDTTPESPWFLLADLGTESPIAYIEYDLGGSTTWARMVEFSDSGRWLVLGYQGSSTITPFHAIPHDGALSSSSSSPTNVVDITGWDSMAVSTNKPRGLAITPSMSVISPRPGKELSGVRKLVVLVRDPEIDRLSFEINGSTTACADDSNLDDGLSTSCEFDASGWSGSSDRIVQVIGYYGEDTPGDSSDDGTMVIEARY